MTILYLIMIVLGALSLMGHTDGDTSDVFPGCLILAAIMGVLMLVISLLVGK